MTHPRDHQERVDAWLTRVDGGTSAQVLVDLLQHALDALWRRAQQTLGDVTVRNVASRTVLAASSRQPLLRALTVHAEGVSCTDLARAVRVGHHVDGRGTTVDADATSVRSAARDVLVELLTVLGDLTANILTAPLHDALLTVGDPGVVSGAEGVRRVAGDGRATSDDERDGGAVLRSVDESSVDVLRRDEAGEAT